MLRFSLLFTLFLAACTVQPVGTYGGYTPGGTPVSTAGAPPRPGLAPPRITKALIPAGRYGRHRMRRMVPRYITIHSTQNYSRQSDARAHAEMLRRGALKGPRNSLGYVTWHFTVDESSIYQSLPETEQGQHADYEGPGNRYSIGIEMCENRGNSRAATMARTARLTAHLMRKYRIPLNRVVPHQHWRMIRYADGRDLGHKNCPHFLLDGGRPGLKWRNFLRMVQSH
ncbi:MAG: N-acetylmuramoyl-L-alanine amidase [Akkermansiaceae bacterium]|nr:N-acetylmuramoyl-L-alanine amidase [Akkermansiaceae bacterium]